MRVVTKIISMAVALVNLPTSRSNHLYDAININNYCPNKNNCPSSRSHIVCKHYDPHKLFGPRCDKYNAYAQITEAQAAEIILRINTLRSQAASGTLKGNHDEMLPRAYGMYKLSWDTELAALAQIQANRCQDYMYKECATTERAPSTVFTWLAKPGLSTEEAVGYYLSALEATAAHLTVDNILVSPNLSKGGYPQFALRALQPQATGVGCAISEYYSENDKKYVVPVVCLYQYFDHTGSPFYNMQRPTPGQGYSEECGCPTNSKEIKGCLCEPLKDRRLLNPEDDNWTEEVVLPAYSWPTADNHGAFTTQTICRNKYGCRSVAPSAVNSYYNRRYNDHSNAGHLNGSDPKHYYEKHTNNEDERPGILERRSLNQIMASRLHDMIRNKNPSPKSFSNINVIRNPIETVNGVFFKNLIGERRNTVGKQPVLDSAEKILFAHHNKMLALDDQEPQELASHHIVPRRHLTPYMGNDSHLVSLLDVVDGDRRHSEVRPSDNWK